MFLSFLWKLKAFYQNICFSKTASVELWSIPLKEMERRVRSFPRSNQVFQTLDTQRAKWRSRRAKGLHLTSRKVEMKEAASQGEFACKCIPLELSRASDTAEPLPYTHHATNSSRHGALAACELISIPTVFTEEARCTSGSPVWATIVLGWSGTGWQHSISKVTWL